MLVPNQEFEITWCPSNINWYRTKGYTYTKFSDKFFVPIKDLPQRCHKKVKVICDYCGQEFIKDYAALNKETADNSEICCYKCRRNKIASTCMEKYGSTSPFGSKEIQEKAQTTFQQKYGVKYPLCSEAMYNKTKESMFKNGNVPTSSQQLKIYDMLKKDYPDCELNRPCGKCFLDCAVTVGGIPIDFEYDGIFWHKEESKDRRRDEFVKTMGYKIIRIKGSHKVPTEEQLKRAINFILKGHNYTFIKLDDI